jgi:exopolyphosphatase/guanosine-5'-triphosphate,3'-diphosphate pyrophosphatase
MRVQKLAAILRIADALDRSHNQRIKDFELERKEEQLLIRCSYVGDISSERLGLQAKAIMFEQVFGLKVILV